jgi:hypothetical protein
MVIGDKNDNDWNGWIVLRALRPKGETFVQGYQDKPRGLMTQLPKSAW